MKRNLRRTITKAQEQEPRPIVVVPAHPMNLDATIVAVADAINAGAGDLRVPLREYLMGGDPTPLRLQLRLLATGVETSPREGATQSLRVQAAQRALDLWSGNVTA